MLFLIAIAALVALATLWFLAAPLRPRAAVIGDAEERESLEAVRERLIVQLNELELERADQSMDAAVAEQEQARLEYDLAQVLKKLEQKPATPERRAGAGLPVPRLAAFAVLLVAPLLAAVLYVFQNQAALRTFADFEGVPSEMKEARLPPMVLEMVARLENRLQEQPDDARGWAQLARSYSVLNRAGDAEAAFERAYAHGRDDVDIVSEYGWFLYSMDPTRPSARAVELYTRVQELNPGHPDALWVLGLAAYQDGDRAKSLRMWEQLLAGLPEESAAKQGVAAAIAQVKKEMQSQPGAGK